MSKNKLMIMAKLTEHFTLEEMYKSSTASRKKINNFPCETIQKKLKTLCKTILEPIRQAWGAPIIISSGYRSQALNKAIGGASTSDHMYGCAADIHTIEDTSSRNKELYNLIVKMIKNGQIKNCKQLIREDSRNCPYDWIHISFQDGRTTKRNQFLTIMN